MLKNHFEASEEPGKERESSMKKWVDIMRVDAAKRESKVVARCILEGGKVRCEGNESFIKNLENEGVFSLNEKKMVKPADGETFLRALGQEFKSAYLFATDVQEGEEVKEPQGLKLHNIMPSKTKTEETVSDEKPKK